MKIEDTFITFAGSVATKRKVEKDVKVKGFIRKGKFVRAFQRKQDVNDKTELAKKVAIGSLITLASVAGLTVAGAAAAKLRYNRNLIKFGENIKANKIPLDMSHPAKNYVSPKEIGDKKSMDFFLGFLSNRSDPGGPVLMKSVRVALKDTNIKTNNELIPLFNNVQVTGKGTFGALDAAVDATKKAVVDGYNMDSVLMAKEIFKWHKLNPTKPINLISHSAGGFHTRDIPHILKASGVDPKLMKVFSMGSPDYGLVDDIIPATRIMNNDDLYTRSLSISDEFKRKQIPSLNRRAVYVGKGYTPEYEKMRYKKAISEADQTGDYSEVDLPFRESRAAAHSLGAYMNGETEASKNTINLLKKFLIRD